MNFAEKNSVPGQYQTQHRANLFNAICQIAVQELGSIPTRKHSLPHTIRPMVVGRSIIFGGHSLDLSSSPITLDLFKLFLDADGKAVTKFDIARRVYGVANPENLSDRYWAATRVNITKLISRARKHASSSLSPLRNDEIAWFPYNTVQDAWELFSFKPKGTNVD